MRIFQYISILLLVGAIGFIIYRNSPHYQIIKGNIFGTYYNIKIFSDKKDKNLKKIIETRFQEINSKMSVFDKSSEISQLNKFPAKKYFKLSEELSFVLQTSKKIWQQSDGWFDPTIGKLIDAWGFGSSKEKQYSNTQIQEIVKSVGFDKIAFSKDKKQIKKHNPEISLNLSAIAKGYAVDEIALVLDKKGYKNYLIEIGGEIKAKGVRSQTDNSWIVGINKPVAGSSDNSIIISLSNLSVATSGNYRNFYQKGGKVYAHTISPKTGHPYPSDILSVTVFHESCMYADAYATAIEAMGSKKGIEFANKHNLKAVIFKDDLEPIYSKTAQQLFME